MSVAAVAVVKEMDDENFSFDIHPNRVETIKFVNAQRKLCDDVATRYPDMSKIFSHEVVVTYFRDT